LDRRTAAHDALPGGGNQCRGAVKAVTGA